MLVHRAGETRDWCSAGRAYCAYWGPTASDTGGAALALTSGSSGARHHQYRSAPSSGRRQCSPAIHCNAIQRKWGSATLSQSADGR